MIFDSMGIIVVPTNNAAWRSIAPVKSRPERHAWPSLSNPGSGHSIRVNSSRELAPSNPKTSRNSRQTFWGLAHFDEIEDRLIRSTRFTLQNGLKLTQLIIQNLSIIQLERSLNQNVFLRTYVLNVLNFDIPSDVRTGLVVILSRNFLNGSWTECCEDFCETHEIPRF